MKAINPGELGPARADAPGRPLVPEAAVSAGVGLVGAEVGGLGDRMTSAAVAEVKF